MPGSVRPLYGTRSRISVTPKAVRQPGLHGRLAGPAGADQGAVDVKQEDAHLAILRPAGRSRRGNGSCRGPGGIDKEEGSANRGNAARRETP